MVCLWRGDNERGEPLLRNSDGGKKWNQMSLLLQPHQPRCHVQKEIFRILVSAAYETIRLERGKHSQPRGRTHSILCLTCASLLQTPAAPPTSYSLTGPLLIVKEQRAISNPRLARGRGVSTRTANILFLTATTFNSKTHNSPNHPFQHSRCPALQLTSPVRLRAPHMRRGVHEPGDVVDHHETHGPHPHQGWQAAESKEGCQLRRCMQAKVLGEVL